VTIGAGLRKSPHDKLRFLAETAMAEAALLRITDGRLFAMPMDAQRAGTLRHGIELAERVDAFVARFGRLQDTAGDKLLPAVLAWLSELIGHLSMKPLADSMSILQPAGHVAGLRRTGEARPQQRHTQR